MRGLAVGGLAVLIVMIHSYLTLSNGIPQRFWLVSYDFAIIWAIMAGFLSFCSGCYVAARLVVAFHDRPRKLGFFEDEGDLN